MQRSWHHDLPADHVCQEADIADLLREAREIAADPHIVHYEIPDVATMRELVAMGQAYRGDWYHSEVTFYTTDETDPEAELLRHQIEQLGHRAGFALIYRWVPRTIAEIKQNAALEQLFSQR